MIDGVKYNKGTVEELIHYLITYTSKDDNKKKFLNVFEKYMDDQNEVSEEELEKILDEVEIKSTQAQRNHLIKLLDTDKDVQLSYDELKTYLDNYNTDMSIASNMMGKGSKQGNMLG